MESLLLVWTAECCCLRLSDIEMANVLQKNKAALFRQKFIFIRGSRRLILTSLFYLEYILYGHRIKRSLF